MVVVITQSKCPECKRLFCAKCKVPWHSGFVCEEFEKLNKDEREIEGLQLVKLVKSEEWQRCPSCRMYVGRSEGCAQMRCSQQQNKDKIENPSDTGAVVENLT
ncbi:hypothetical protein MTR67_011214 [Solanum verrucosum]|uniref:IBR domain-containing protein n=1 Tax=Solanum verrucosum TaxID=315347 RepID=A0AAF0TGB7_SOLVR|nr:hypothetical protein MTR67_011214 [Solanum verrucosum]